MHSRADAALVRRPAVRRPAVPGLAALLTGLALLLGALTDVAGAGPASAAQPHGARAAGPVSVPASAAATGTAGAPRTAPRGPRTALRSLLRGGSREAAAPVAAHDAATARHVASPEADGPGGAHHVPVPHAALPPHVAAPAPPASTTLADRSPGDSPAGRSVVRAPGRSPPPDAAPHA